MSVASTRFRGVFSQSGGQTWRSRCKLNNKDIYCGTHPTEEAAAKARDRVNYKLHGAACQDMQIGLSEDEKRALDAITLEQLLAQLKRARLEKPQGATSKYLGVYPTPSGKWVAKLKRAKKTRSQTFMGEYGAARAFDLFALQALGRGALTNFQYSDAELKHICGSRAKQGPATAGISAKGAASGEHRRSHAGQLSRCSRKAAARTEDEASGDERSSHEENIDLVTATTAGGQGIAGRLRRRGGQRCSLRELTSSSEGDQDDDVSSCGTDGED